MNIRDYLKENRIITDGAMGTYYASLYPEEDALVERANLAHPERIQSIHEQYLASGANLLRTNTFAVNSNFFDKAEIPDYIKAGYAIAQSAVTNCGQEAFIAADIGPIFDLEGKTDADILSEYQTICDAFLEAGAEIFLFETQAEFYYLEEIAEYIKKQKSDAYVMASFSFDKTGYTKAGVNVERMISAIAQMDVIDAYGLNCGVEGNHMYQLLAHVDLADKPLLALPNAGYPIQLRGKTIYGKNLNYFLQMEERLLSLGVDFIGGCCGTTPEYIAGIPEILARTDRSAKRIGSFHGKKSTHTFSQFYNKLERGEKPFIVELDPPYNTNADKVFEGARLLREHDVDLLGLSDSPMARSRMDPSLLGTMIQREIGISVMPHITCRDRNVIALRGTVMGDYYNDVKHFLVVTGDPIASHDRGMVTPVFDYNSVKFMGLLQEMNQDIFADDLIVYGGALNYHGANADAIAQRMKMKMERGCSYFLTQPIYSDEDIARIAYLREQTGAKIMVGIMPLVSYKNATFIANEMPGIFVPEEIIAAYQPNMSREESEAVARRISVDIARKLEPIADGYYFMTPFNRVQLICDIIEEIRAGA